MCPCCKASSEGERTTIDAIQSTSRDTSEYNKPDVQNTISVKH